VKLFKLLLVVVALALIATPALAADPAATTDHMSGKISKIDQANNQVQVQSSSGEMRTLAVDDSTNIMNAQGQKASLSDLKEGDKVKASFCAADNKVVAKDISVQPEQKPAQ
jgi:Cu/Ag efflux protein CusF